MNSDQVYNTILRIRLTTARNKKLPHLRTIPPIFAQYTYHPHWTYQFSKDSPVAFFKGRGKKTFSTDTFSLLQSLRDRKITGTDALNHVHHEVRFLTHWSAELLKLVLFKDWNCGVASKTILKLWPGLFPHEFCMKAHDLDPALIKFPCLAEPKIDGLRGIYRDNGIYSSSGRLYKGLEHIVYEIQEKKLSHQHWDGEITVPGANFDAASGMIRSNSPTPAARLTVFDVPTLESELLLNRLKYINCALSGMKFVKPIPCNSKMMWNMDDIETFFRQSLKNGYEGIMVKQEHCPYVYDRSYNWMKMKKFDTQDLRVIGIEEGKGKHAGRVGSLLLEDGGNCGMGMTDIERDLWWSEPGLIVDKIIEVAFMEKSSKGIRRHPKFIRTRHDKE